MGTKFVDIYNCFLGKITDDAYIELTPADTIQDLQQLLIHAIPNFEFPRVILFDNYNILVETKLESEVEETDFIIGVVWNQLEEDDQADDQDTPYVLVESSTFNVDLTWEEINILATLMMEGWLQRQITSIEITRMKFSGSDFKLTSQANHLSKLLTLHDEVVRQSTHLQRLYKRRKIDSDGNITSNWKVFNTYNTSSSNSSSSSSSVISARIARAYTNEEILAMFSNAH